MSVNFHSFATERVSTTIEDNLKLYHITLDTVIGVQMTLCACTSYNSKANLIHELVNLYMYAINDYVILKFHIFLAPPPPEVQAFCSVVVWNSPNVSCDGINGYDVRLYHPQSSQHNLTRSVNGNFYTLKDEDRFVNNHETLVQVTISL